MTLQKQISIAELIASGVLSAGDGYRTKRDQLSSSGYRIVRVADVSNGAVDLSGADCVAEEYGRAIGDKAGVVGDVVLTTKGTVGRVAIVRELREQIVYSPQVCYFRIRDKQVLTARFLAFWFASPEFLEQAAHRMNNTDMAAYINLADIRSLKISLPSIGRQRAIVDVLGSLDDKISANLKLVGTLDSHMAASVSASSHGGRHVNLEDVVDFHNRRRIPLSASEREARKGSVPYYGASGVFGHVNEALFDFPMVLVGEDGSVINHDSTPVVQYVWGPAWVNNHAHVLTGQGVSTELLYQIVRGANVSTLVTGAVQPKINMGNLKKLAVVVPSGSALFLLEETIAVETSLKRNLVIENRTLTELRDTLLPELMSGRLRVKDAEKKIDEVV